MDVFFDGVAAIIEQARVYVGRAADRAMCVTCFEIGRLIVEREQGGKARAEYGRGLLKELSEYLGKRFGKGFSESTLTSARKFYQVYAPSISQTMFAKLGIGSNNGNPQTLPADYKNGDLTRMGQALSAQSHPLTLSWSH